MSPLSSSLTNFIPLSPDRRGRGTLKSIRSYADTCLSGMQKQTALLLARGLSTNLKNSCTGTASRHNLLKTLRCMKKIVPDIRVYMRQFADDYRSLKNESDAKRKVTGMCCSYIHFQEVSNDKASAHCKSSSASDFKAFFSTIAGDLMSLLCSNLSAQSTQCIEYNVRANRHNRTLPQHGASITFLPPLLSLLHDF